MTVRVVWTGEALDDLVDILAYYHEQAGPLTAQAVERRIVEQVLALKAFPERIRASERLPGTRELVIQRLPYIAFVQVMEEAVLVLNVVHTARKFPA